MVGEQVAGGSGNQRKWKPQGKSGSPQAPLPPAPPSPCSPKSPTSAPVAAPTQDLGLHADEAARLISRAAEPPPPPPRVGLLETAPPQPKQPRRHEGLGMQRPGWMEGREGRLTHARAQQRPETARSPPQQHPTHPIPSPDLQAAAITLVGAWVACTEAMPATAPWAALHRAPSLRSRPSGMSAAAAAALPLQAGHQATDACRWADGWRDRQASLGLHSGRRRRAAQRRRRRPRQARPARGVAAHPGALQRAHCTHDRG